MSTFVLTVLVEIQELFNKRFSGERASCASWWAGWGLIVRRAWRSFRGEKDGSVHHLVCCRMSPADLSPQGWAGGGAPGGASPRP